MLYRYKSYILDNIVSLSLCSPNPHKFYSVRLQSGNGDKKSLSELILERRNKIIEYNKGAFEIRKAQGELRTVDKAKRLDDMLPDKSQNAEMKKIMNFYESYFDDESGNSREEGIKQVQDYIKGEIRNYQKRRETLKTEIKAIEKELDDRKELDIKKAVEENTNTLLPIIPINSFTIFSILLTVFSFIISFKLIDFDLNYLIFHITGIVIPTIIISAVLFLWEYYRLYNRIRKYYIICKRIYMFCKTKIYSFYKK